MTDPDPGGPKNYDTNPTDPDTRHWLKECTEVCKIGILAPFFRRNVAPTVKKATQSKLDASKI